MQNNETVNLFEHIQYNEAVDRIRFIDFDDMITASSKMVSNGGAVRDYDLL